MEGQHAGAHLIEHRAEREQIRAAIEFFSADLLRAHVQRRFQWRCRGWSDFPPTVTVGAEVAPPNFVEVSLASPKSRTLA